MRRLELQDRALFHNQLLDFLHELRRPHVFRLIFPARADVYLVGLGFFVANHQQKRNLLHRVFADFRIHLFVARIHFHAHSFRPQLRRYFFRVLRMALGDRDHRYLHRRQPHRERSGVVFDQHAEEALDRSVERAVDHHWLLAAAVFGYVFELEALRQVEIELYGAELPGTADGIHKLDVNLRAIESCFAGHNLVWDIKSLQRALQRMVGEVPLILTAEEALLVLRIPGGKLGFELVEAEGLQHGECELQAADDFSFDLIRSTKNVSVVLGEAANAQQSVHHARTLVAIDGAEFAQAHRQIAI